MANEEQLELLKQGSLVWNNWRVKNLAVQIDLSGADLTRTDLSRAHLGRANLSKANLRGADLIGTLLGAGNLRGANLGRANLTGAYLGETNLADADLREANLNEANLKGSNLLKARLGATVFGNSDLSETTGLEDVVHEAPSAISNGVFARSKGKIPEVFLRGCGLSDWEIEQAKLYNPHVSNDEITQIQYKVYDLRAAQAIQISPLYISYSHADHPFVEKLEVNLKEKGIRFWRDIHELTAGRMEKQFDRAMRQNPTVVLILSSNSIKSDWVEHEVRLARGLEKELEHDVLCPVALDESWKSSPWPKRIMEQIMEYNILDFSAWKDDSQFEGMFRKLIDGLELFYKGEVHGK